MENEQKKENPAMDKDQVPDAETMLREIWENTQKTKTYMKWQLYITVALVVIPILSILVLVPIVMSSLGNISAIYTGGGLQ